MEATCPPALCYRRFHNGLVVTGWRQKKKQLKNNKKILFKKKIWMPESIRITSAAQPYASHRTPPTEAHLRVNRSLTHLFLVFSSNRMIITVKDEWNIKVREYFEAVLALQPPGQSNTEHSECGANTDRGRCRLLAHSGELGRWSFFFFFLLGFSWICFEIDRPVLLVRPTTASPKSRDYGLGPEFVLHQRRHIRLFL